MLLYVALCKYGTALLILAFHWLELAVFLLMTLQVHQAQSLFALTVRTFDFQVIDQLLDLPRLLCLHFCCVAVRACVFGLNPVLDATFTEWNFAGLALGWVVDHIETDWTDEFLVRRVKEYVFFEPHLMD